MANEQGNSVEPSQNNVEKAVMDSGDFFDQLDNSVNGMVGEGDRPEEAPIKQPAEATHVRRGSEQGNPQNESHGSNTNAWDSDNNPYKKRYKDSSREAVKMNQTLRELKPFIPVLDAMKRDSGLVNHVKDYLKNGGTPSKNVKQHLGLPTDFEFNQQEAIDNPDSDSAKVLEAQVEQVVNTRVNSILGKEKENAQKMRQQMAVKKQEQDFRSKYKMSDDQFEGFKQAAAERKLTYDDVYYLLNKDKANQNVANATKQDMLNQMKAVRNVPTSASDSNNQGAAMPSVEDNIFDTIASTGGVDDLFG
jgi:hypothetical protein